MEKPNLYFVGQRKGPNITKFPLMIIRWPVDCNRGSSAPQTSKRKCFKMKNFTKSEYVAQGLTGFNLYYFTSKCQHFMGIEQITVNCQ